MRFFVQGFSLADGVTHPSVRAFPALAAQHQSFMIWHGAGAAALMSLTAVLMTVIGWPARLPLPSALWLASPLLAPVVLRMTGNMQLSQLISLVSLSGVITLVSFHSGAEAASVSMALLILPIAAILTRDQSLIIAGGALGALCAGVVALAGLPLPGPDAGAYFIATLAVLSFATLVAVMVQARLTKTEKAALQGEADYRFLSEQVPDILMRHGPDGDLTYVSPACRSVLGRESKDLLGRSLLRFVHSEDQGEVEKVFERAGFFGGEVSLEYRVQHREGHYIWVETRAKPVVALGMSGMAPSLKGLPMPACFELVSVTRDITSRKTHELALAHKLEVAELANQSKSQFLANMSHELRTPLNAVIGFSEMIKEQTFGPIGVPKYLEYAGLITSSGHHLLGLINDILDMSKIESGKYSLALEQIDAARIIRGSLSLVRVASDKAGVKINAAIENDIPQFCADKRALKQILLNLLSNAVKFTPKGGVITVGASNDADMFYLQVLDTGIGISQEDLERLGQPYEQVIDQYTKNKIGTGLGLSLVSALAELHGGGVSIESVVGAGTCVTVSLPLRQAQTGQGQSEETTSDLAVVIDNDDRPAAAARTGALACEAKPRPADPPQALKGAA